ncbi:hypothetical protein LOK49_LG02G02003 [Camellia lanceoleosa]|uniref:Uncharacterized protein n=1 Tax=Camellia lanceoleosa TaxID=1840588 RepID=A0ACC0IN21_9ERIC|nr:hypothetical protein LOK49_LG02G02003 [Camellia lanceoleosa]
MIRADKRVSSASSSSPPLALVSLPLYSLSFSPLTDRSRYNQLCIRSSLMGDLRFWVPHHQRRAMFSFFYTITVNFNSLSVSLKQAQAQAQARDIHFYVWDLIIMLLVPFVYWFSLAASEHFLMVRL